MNIKFTKTKPIRTFQGVVDQIQAAILDGSLSAGDKLPSEMKLKDMFETSRGTIREALRILEQKGLIDIKTGVTGGAIVKAVNTEKITESLDLLIQYKKISTDHLAEFRREVEGIVTSLAAERATEQDIKKLKRILAKAQKELKKGIDGQRDFFRTDVELHISLAEIARNPLFVAVLRMVHENILGNWLRFSPDNLNILEENYQDLYDIVGAVERREANQARALAHDHVQRFNRHMRRYSRKAKSGKQTEADRGRPDKLHRIGG